MTLPRLSDFVATEATEERESSHGRSLESGVQSEGSEKGNEVNQSVKHNKSCPRIQSLRADELLQHLSTLI